MAATYDNVERMTYAPTKAANAVVEPTYMHPRMVVKTPQKMMARKGLWCCSSTLAKKWLNGVALSRARVQKTRLAVTQQPMDEMNVGRKTRKSRPTDPERVPVAWR